jgi:hypothetical protein
VFENRVLRRIFGLKRDEIIEVWRQLNNELHDTCMYTLHVSVVNSRRMRNFFASTLL